MHWLDTYRMVGAAAATEGGYYNQLEYLTGFLRKAGFRDNIIAYLLAQIMYETNDLASSLAELDNNFSGIKFVGQKEADYKTPSGFAGYKTPDRWAADYYRVLSLSPGRPVDATSAQDFHTRLLQNGYYGTKTAGSYADKKYVAGFNAKLKKVSDVLKKATELGQQYKSGQMKEYTTGPTIDKKSVKKRNQKFDVNKFKTTKIGQWVSDHPLIAAGIGTVGVVVLVKIVEK